MARVKQILMELAFFLTLAVLSQTMRQLARWRGYKKSLVKGFHVGSLVLSWYSVSVTLSLYNKWLVASWQDGGLRCPIFYTMTHMMIKGFVSLTYLSCIRREPLPKVKRKVVLGTTMMGIMTALDVVASNLSFLYISVSFFTMLKSASLIFILAFGAIGCVEPCTVKIFLTVCLICVGIFLASYGEADFNLIGFCLVIASEMSAAIRWIITQIVLQRGKLDSMVAVFFMSPSATLTLIPLIVVLERDKVDLLDNLDDTQQYMLIVWLPGLLAFMLLLVEVQLVKETSGLTLSVFGNLKSIVTIVFAMLVFGEKASLLQWLGLSIALSGIFAYSYVKKRPVSVDALAAAAQYHMLPQEDEDEAHIPARVLSPQSSEAASSPKIGAGSPKIGAAACELATGPEEGAAEDGATSGSSPGAKVADQDPALAADGGAAAQPAGDRSPGSDEGPGVGEATPPAGPHRPKPPERGEPSPLREWV